MAFEWFRRRQKLMIGLMVALMISFLVGYTGFEMLFRTDPMKFELGTTEFGDMTQGDLLRASNDLDALRMIGLTSLPMLMLEDVNAAEQKAELAYALLVREAEQNDVTVTDADIFGFIGYEPDTADYEGWLSQIRSRVEITEQSLHGMIRRWLMVQKNFSASLVRTPPSEPRIRELFRDLAEQINLRVVRLDAERYLEEVSEPSAAAIREQFDKYRSQRPGVVRNPRDLGFGYRQPDRVRIQYLLVRRGPVRRALTFSEEQIERFYRENREMFTRTAPVETQPTTAPATAPAETQPAERPPATQTVQLSFGEAYEDVKEALRQRRLGTHLEDVVARTEQVVRDAPEDFEGNPLQWAYDQLRRPAEGMLSKPVEIPGGAGTTPLKTLIRRLERAAGLSRIVYPWGAHEDVQIDPDIEIAHKASYPTLQTALTDIGRQIRLKDIVPSDAETRPTTAPATAPSEKSDLPTLSWAGARGFPGVLFPVKGIDLFPYEAGETDLLGAQELRNHPILANTAPSLRGGQGVGELAFEAKPFVSGPQQTPSMEVGQYGAPMFAASTVELLGKVVWRLAEARAAHDPQSIDDAPDLREQVVRDLKIKRALERAARQARTLMNEANRRDDKLVSILQATDLPHFQTGLFSRREMVLPQQQMRMRLQIARAYGQIGDAEYATGLRRSQMVRPVVFQVARVPKLDINRPVVRRHLVNEVFKLIPRTRTQPAESSVAMLSLPAERTVLLVQRIGYRPPLEAVYTGQKRLDELALAPEGQSPELFLRNTLDELRFWQLSRAWFQFANIAQRVEWAPREE